MDADIAGRVIVSGFIVSLLAGSYQLFSVRLELAPGLIRIKLSENITTNYK
jgi:hypothetical protein